VSRNRLDTISDRDVQGPPPSTARTDRGRKRALYQETGVREYWIVDVELRQVEVWRPGVMEAEVWTDAVRWQPEPGIEGLTIELEKIFRPV